MNQSIKSINQSIKCHLFRHIRAPYIFPALPQDSLFSDDESEAPNGESLALIVGDVKQECPDAALECLEGRRGSCS